MTLKLRDLTADDWRWLKSRYGDFVLEEPDYAPALIEIRNMIRTNEVGLDEVDAQ